MCPAPPSDSTWHMGCRPGDLAKTVILTARADHALQLAAQLDEYQIVGSRREYLSLTGTHSGHLISVCSAGYGSPPVAIAVEEIHKVGAKNLLWIGELAPFDPPNQPTDVGGPPKAVIVWAAVRGESTSRQYVPLAYPALSDPEVAGALEDAALEIGLNTCLSTVITVDVPITRAPSTSSGRDELNIYRQAGVLGWEVSVSALLVAARLAGMRAGALLRLSEAEGVCNSVLMQVCLSAMLRLEFEREGQSE